MSRRWGVDEPKLGMFGKVNLLQAYGGRLVKKPHRAQGIAVG